MSSHQALVAHTSSLLRAFCQSIFSPFAQVSAGMLAPARQPAAAANSPSEATSAATETMHKHRADDRYVTGDKALALGVAAGAVGSGGFLGPALGYR